jgi:hypothetical protein
MTISKWTAGLNSLRLASSSFLIFFFERAATTRQGIIRMLTGYKEIPKKALSRQTTVLDFLRSSVETRASPFLLLDIGDDDPNNQPIVQEEVPPP